MKTKQGRKQEFFSLALEHEEHWVNMTLYNFYGLPFHNYSSDQLRKCLGYSLNIVESIRVV